MVEVRIITYFECDSFCPLTEENDKFLLGDKFGRHAILYVDRTGGTILTLVALGEVCSTFRLLHSIDP